MHVLQTRRRCALLKALDVHPADTVMIHASFSALSRKGFRAEHVVDELADYLTSGTLAMPSMSWRAVNMENPVFDELKTPAITGVLSETFRLRYATHRSLHPTHSVAALGNKATELTAGHHLDVTPCGRSSPWALLAKHDAHVIMLGVGMDTCTLVHCLEERHEPEKYLHDRVEEYVCRDRQGREHKVRTRRHRKLLRNFWKFQDVLHESGLIRHTDIEGTPAFALRANDLMQLGMNYMRSNPLGTLAGPSDPSKLM